MPLTPQEAIATWTARGFAIRYAEKAGGWVAYTPAGTRVQVPPQVGPVEAIEAADLHLSARDDESLRRDLKRLVALMQDGRYFHRSRLIQEDDGAGGTTQARVFDMIRANGTGSGSVTSIVGRKSVVVAWRDLDEALTAGQTP